MDWENLTFLIGTLVAMIVKQFVFKDDTVIRDRVLPVLVFVANFLARLIQELAGPGIPASQGALGGSDLQLAAFWDWELVRLLGVTSVDWLMSMGLHRAKRWRDAFVLAPKRKR